MLSPQRVASKTRCLACCEDHEASSCRKLQLDGALSCPSGVLEELDTLADEMCDLDAVNTLDRWEFVRSCATIIAIRESVQQ